MTPHGRKFKAYDPDPNAPGQLCNAPDCHLAGEYPAPKSKTGPREFHWFCLAHVRAFNASWDYYKGMSPDEIEAEIRADSSWQRPSWPLGQLGKPSHMDVALEEELRAFAFGERAKAPPANAAPPDLREPLAVLGLLWPVTLETVKAKYKELAKRHHPDANGGDKGAEERLKSINLAYAALRGKLAVQHAPAAQ